LPASSKSRNFRVIFAIGLSRWAVSARVCGGGEIETGGCDPVGAGEDGKIEEGSALEREIESLSPLIVSEIGVCLGSEDEPCPLRASGTAELGLSQDATGCDCGCLDAVEVLVDERGRSTCISSFSNSSN